LHASSERSSWKPKGLNLIGNAKRGYILNNALQ
jgi:hypothetical protein